MIVNLLYDPDDTLSGFQDHLKYMCFVMFAEGH